MHRCLTPHPRAHRRCHRCSLGRWCIIRPGQYSALCMGYARGSTGVSYAVRSAWYWGIGMAYALLTTGDFVWHAQLQYWSAPFQSHTHAPWIPRTFEQTAGHSGLGSRVLELGDRSRV
eukprot:513220-Rhodomonas_salina.1